MLLFDIMGGALKFPQARALASHHLFIPKEENKTDYRELKQLCLLLGECAKSICREQAMECK